MRWKSHGGPFYTIRPLIEKPWSKGHKINIKMVSYQYGISKYKGKTVSWLSYLYQMVISIPGKMTFISKWAQVPFEQRFGYFFVVDQTAVDLKKLGTGKWLPLGVCKEAVKVSTHDQLWLLWLIQVSPETTRPQSETTSPH